FGAGNPATIVSDDGTTLVVASPPGAVGTVDIIVTTPAGTSTITATDQFTYRSLPTGSIASLSAFSRASFTLNWSGQPGPGGPSIASYDIYVSDNGAAFQRFLTGTVQTSTTFNGQNGHTYGFYSVAI